MENFLLSIPPMAFAILSAIGISAWGLANRKIMGKEKDYIAAGGLNEILSSLILALAIIFLGAGFLTPGAAPIQAISAEGIFAISISLFCYVAATFMTYKAFQTAQASERAIINQLQNIIVILFASLFLGEALTGAKIFGGILIIAGTAICVLHGKKMRLHVEGVRLFALASIFFGAATLADKVAIAYFPLLLYALVQFAAPALVAIAYMGKSAASRMQASFKRHGAWIVALAFTSVLPYLCFLYALSLMPASVVGPIINTNVVLSALGGMLLLGEKDGWQQKFAGAILAFIGAALISA